MKIRHEITALKDPVGPTDATTMRWVESKIPKGVYNLLAYVKGSPDSHTVEYKDDNVLSVTYRKVGTDKQLIFSFRNALIDGYYMYDFTIDKTGSDTTGVEVYLYGEAGLSDTNASTTYRFWASNKGSSGRDFAVRKQSGTGKSFLRMYGTNVDIHGEFELRGQEVFNHGMPFVVNSGGTNGETYELL